MTGIRPGSEPQVGALVRIRTTDGKADGDYCYLGDGDWVSSDGANRLKMRIRWLAPETVETQG